MTDIDPLSQTIGRIEEKCDTILKQNSELFTKINANDQRVASLQSTVDGIQTGNKVSHAVWGAGSGGAIVAIAEILKSIWNSK